MFMSLYANKTKGILTEQRFLGELREYVFITELDEAILNWLIDKIIISAVEVIYGEKVQKVRIVYNFVGEF